MKDEIKTAGQAGPFQSDYEPPREYEITGASVNPPPRRRLPVFLQAMQAVLGSALVIATFFTMWMPGIHSSSNSAYNPVLGANSAATDNNAVIPDDFPLEKIGLVIGHRGNANDPGFVCPDGLTELQVNTTIASLLQKRLIDLGYQVEILDEFDDRLTNYKAGLLLSIHSDSCDYINDSATGFKIAPALSENRRHNIDQLTGCIINRYGKATGLKYQASVTNDMSFYHAFTEINPWTTAGIIEAGYLNLDRQILTQDPEKLADALAAGVKCYMNREVVDPDAAEPTNAPRVTPTGPKMIVPMIPTPGGATATP